VSLRDHQAEREVLADIILDNSNVDRVRRIIEPEAFDLPEHRMIYRAALDLYDRGEPADVVTIRATLNGKLSYLPERLASILDMALPPSSSNASGHARALASVAWRRSLAIRAEGIVHAASNGITDRDLAELVATMAEERSPDRGIDVTNLHAAEVAVCRPEFTVVNLIRKSGLHLFWAQPGGHKTTLALVIVHELMREHVEGQLLGHPDLEIRRPWRRVLWIATEETEGTLAYSARAVRDGLGNPDLDGELLYVFAAGHHRVTLDDLPALVAQHGPLDAIVLDSLTGLRPKVRDGQRVKWDLDNDAANEQCLLLRGLAAEHDLAVVMLHHSDKTVTNYRGPTDWWASADVMLGLRAADGRVKVEPQKNRSGRLIDPFYLTPEWDGDVFRVSYDGDAREGDGLTQRETQALAYLGGCVGDPNLSNRTNAGLAAFLGCDTSRARRLTVSLKQKGRITEDGKHERATVWVPCAQACGLESAHFEGAKL
jgi:hypothetical protein